LHEHGQCLQNVTVGSAVHAVEEWKWKTPR
jgi:hypothetical protein